MTRNNNNKGFTLVELIVVLAILAILAAMLVPSLTGYIDKAKIKKDLSNARYLLEATQSSLSEVYAVNHYRICDAKENAEKVQTHACSVVTPITNAINPPDSNNELKLRYSIAYEFAKDIFKDDKKIFISVLSERGIAIEAIYYSQGSSYMLLWTKDSQSWNEIEYNTSLWRNQYSYCDASNSTPYWNGSESFDPKVRFG